MGRVMVCLPGSMFGTPWFEYPASPTSPFKELLRPTA